jgi:hypothetical protein
VKSEEGANNLFFPSICSSFTNESSNVNLIHQTKLIQLFLVVLNCLNDKLSRRPDRHQLVEQRRNLLIGKDIC